MRWIIKRPSDLDTRIVSKFLWFPTQIGLEVRWLETARIVQKYYLGLGWVNEEWAN